MFYEKIYFSKQKKLEKSDICFTLYRKLLQKEDSWILCFAFIML